MGKLHVVCDVKRHHRNVLSKLTQLFLSVYVYIQYMDNFELLASLLQLLALPLSSSPAATEEEKQACLPRSTLYARHLQLMLHFVEFIFLFGNQGKRWRPLMDEWLPATLPHSPVINHNVEILLRAARYFKPSRGGRRKAEISLPRWRLGMDRGPY